MKTFRAIITKVDGPLFDGDAVSLSVPGADGDLTILAEHEPFITPVKAGVVRVKTPTDEQTFEIDGGVLETSGDQATLLL